MALTPAQKKAMAQRATIFNAELQRMAEAHVGGLRTLVKHAKEAGLSARGEEYVIPTDNFWYRSGRCRKPEQGRLHEAVVEHDAAGDREDGRHRPQLLRHLSDPAP